MYIHVAGERYNSAFSQGPFRTSHTRGLDSCLDCAANPKISNWAVQPPWHSVSSLSSTSAPHQRRAYTTLSLSLSLTHAHRISFARTPKRRTSIERTMTIIDTIDRRHETSHQRLSISITPRALKDRRAKTGRDIPLPGCLPPLILIAFFEDLAKRHTQNCSR